MKVIYCGFSKCGTKSMALALRRLGLTVHDFMENFEEHGDEWAEICTRGGSRELFRSMYEGVDAVTDIPCFHYWEEILDAFPEAKLILCERDEDEWMRSMAKQLRKVDFFFLKLLQRLSPTNYKLNRHIRRIFLPATGTDVVDYVCYPIQFCEQTLRMAYRRHNSYVKNKAPKDKLLIWNLGDGYEPICKFLDLPMPADPEFPHRNKNSAVWEEWEQEGNKTMKKINTEITIALFAIGSAAVLFTAYNIHHRCGWKYLTEAPRNIFARLQSIAWK